MHLLRSLSLLLLVCVAACRTTPDAPGEPRGVHFGEPLEPRPALPYSVVVSSPSDHLERTLLVEATVTAVCKKKGCWMQVEDGGETAMVRWESGCDGKYAFPADAVGKRVRIQGSFYPKTISPEDAEHLQQEAGGGGVIAVAIPEETWELNTSAVVVLD